MITIEQANSKLCQARDKALTVFADQMVEAGLNVDDAAFESAMLRYLQKLEHWRLEMLDRIIAKTIFDDDEQGTMH